MNKFLTTAIATIILVATPIVALHAQTGNVPVTATFADEANIPTITFGEGIEKITAVQGTQLNYAQIIEAAGIVAKSADGLRDIVLGEGLSLDTKGVQWNTAGDYMIKITAVDFGFPTEPTDPETSLLPAELAFPEAKKDLPITIEVRKEDPIITIKNKNIKFRQGTNPTEQDIRSAAGIDAKDINGEPVGLTINMDKLDVQTVGQYPVYISAKDGNSNEVTDEISVEITDKNLPEITSTTTELELEANVKLTEPEFIAKAGIIANDAMGNELAVRLALNGLNLAEPQMGKYVVKALATAQGDEGVELTAELELTVTVAMEPFRLQANDIDVSLKTLKGIKPEELDAWLQKQVLANVSIIDNKTFMIRYPKKVTVTNLEDIKKIDVKDTYALNVKIETGITELGTVDYILNLNVGDDDSTNPIDPTNPTDPSNPGKETEGGLVSTGVPMMETLAAGGSLVAGSASYLFRKFKK